MAYVANYLNAVASLTDAEASTGQYLLVALGVQLGEPLAEFKLVTVNHYGAVCPLLALHGVLGQTGGIDAEEITYTGFL